MRVKIQLWLHGLVAAILTSAATAGIAMFSSPEIVLELGYVTLAKVAGGGAVVGALAYLKQSPLPPPKAPTEPPVD